MHEHVTRRRVDFADTDMAGIVHFARFFVFMETAEHRFREALGHPVVAPDGGVYGWPRVAASCDYRRPARFGDELTIRTRIAEVGRSSLKFAFVFEREGEVLAEGELTSVYCRMEPRVEPVPMPEDLLAAIEPPS